jgi:hypothetical protein
MTHQSLYQIVGYFALSVVCFLSVFGFIRLTQSCTIEKAAFVNSAGKSIATETKRC